MRLFDKFYDLGTNGLLSLNTVGSVRSLCNDYHIDEDV